MSAARVRKLSLYLIFAAPLSFLALEGLTRVGYRVIRGESFRAHRHRRTPTPGSGWKREAKRLPEGRGGMVWAGGKYAEALHPYLGFVPVPAGRDGTKKGLLHHIRPRLEDQRLVGVFGGSFAAGVCRHGQKSFQNLLSEPGKRAIILCFAVAGYKQPQQLMLLTYFLSLGGVLDIAINIDGFNEVALPLVENTPKGVFPIYPRAWFHRMLSVEDAVFMSPLAALFALDREHERWTQSPLARLANHSAVLSLLSKRRERALARERARLVDRLNQLKGPGDLPYGVTGPQVSFESDSATYEYLAQVWRDSSIQMKRLGDGNGIDYYHFLQPNQYVVGSKPMTEEEKEVAIRETHLYRTGVIVGYPTLRKLGPELVAAGVDYFDLTMAFREIEEPLYNDDCCHLTPKGYVVTARQIGNLIRNKMWKARQQESSQRP